MARSRAGFILAVAPTTAFADAGGPGLELAVMLAAAYYIFLCLVTVPIALAKRIGVLIGFAAPILGLVMAFAVTELSKWAQSNFAPFFVLSALPTICLAFFPARTPEGRTFGAIRIALFVVTVALLFAALAVISEMVGR